MEKKKYGIIILVTILFLIISFVSAYVIINNYHVNNDDNESVTNNENNQEDNDENNQIDNSDITGVSTNQTMNEKINELINKYGSLEKYFEEYIKFIPLRYDNNSKLSSYKVSGLTDKEISMAVWRYIYKTNDGLLDNGFSISEVNKYIKNYLGLDNYDVKLMETNDNHAFGLSKDNSNYYITAWATEFSFADFKVRKVNYDLNKKTINVEGYSYYIEMGSDGEITIDQNIRLEIQYDNSFKLIKLDIVK